MKLYLILLFVGIAAGCRAAPERAPVDAQGDAPPPLAAEVLGAQEPLRPVSHAEAIEVADQDPEPAEEIPIGEPAEVSSGDQPAEIRLTLVQAIDTALALNPDLVALRRNEGVSQGALGVARTYPFNPFVQVQATPFQDAKLGGPGTTNHYVLLMQTLQLGHQQRFREASAMAALTSVRWNIHQAELLNMAQTERLYFTALYQRGLRDLARENARLNEQLEAVLSSQLDAGQASGADLAIVRLDHRATRQQFQLAEAIYQTALLDLRRQLNLPIDAPLELAEGLEAWDWASPAEVQSPREGQLDEVAGQTPHQELTYLIAGRPDVMAARADLAAARGNASLARASRRPDLQLGPYYQRSEGGTTSWGFRAQTDIPVINNGTPLVRQREAEVRQRYTAWRQLQVRAELEAAAALARYERALRLVAEAKEDSGVDMPDELRRLEEQLKAGEVDIVRVFTARTSLLQLRRARLDALNEMAQAAAALTAATGLTPDALMAPLHQ